MGWPGFARRGVVRPRAAPTRGPGPRPQAADLGTVEHVVEQPGAAVPALEGLGHNRLVACEVCAACCTAVNCALCLDEPLSALDEQTHAEICKLLKETIKQQKITVLHITHNPSEAEALADLSFHLDQNIGLTNK